MRSVVCLSPPQCAVTSSGKRKNKEQDGQQVNKYKIRSSNENCEL
jgi:hypothetical protein